MDRIEHLRACLIDLDDRIAELTFLADTAVNETEDLWGEVAMLERDRDDLEGEYHDALSDEHDILVAMETGLGLF